jgi:hypothetical protein
MGWTTSPADLARAFPASLRDDAIAAVSVLPQAPLSPIGTLSVRVVGGDVSIPYRIYHDPALIDTTRLTSRQVELLDCLLTRHHSGFVREEYLARVICLNHDWIPPFVVQLVGEYVVEIIRVIQQNSVKLDAQLYRRFLTDNPAFLAITKQRVVSYWDCYHRWQRREDYPGFQVLAMFDRFVKKND